MKKFKMILIGAGARGKRYCDAMKNVPEKYEIVCKCRCNIYRESLSLRLSRTCACKLGDRCIQCCSGADCRRVA